jgi:hypothetical protein
LRLGDLVITCTPAEGRRPNGSQICAFFVSASSTAKTAWARDSFQRE